MAQLAFGQLGEQLGVAGAREQGGEHLAARDSEHVGGYAGELDPGVFEHLVQPVSLTLALLDQRLAITRQVTQRPDRLGRHEARPQQPALKQLTEPLRVQGVGLAPGDELDHRLHELRPSLPREVTVTAVHHPLCGERLAVEGRRRVSGVRCLIVRLPDGTPGTVEAAATSAAPAATEPRSGALLSVDGVRRLRGVLAPRAAGDRGSGT